jgi:hypothetical protein
MRLSDGAARVLCIGDFFAWWALNQWNPLGRCAIKIERIKCAFFPATWGSVMIRWCPDWQTAVAWLVVTAVASVIYFGPMTRVLDFGH